MKKLIFIIALTALLMGCTPNMLPEEMEEKAKASMKMIEDTPYEDMIHDWKMFQMRDINGGRISVNQFAGKPVLLETFAVWCSASKNQQKQFKKLNQDEVVIISVNNDPSEDLALVKEHVEDNRFGWHFVKADIEMTLALMDSFGSGIVNSPSTPVILICPDGEDKLLSGGIKTDDELEEAIENC
jgi:cytochrome oxidase Cu insertion factor (SCO1/SenC/PrrC family)